MLSIEHAFLSQLTCLQVPPRISETHDILVPYAFTANNAPTMFARRRQTFVHSDWHEIAAEKKVVWIACLKWSTGSIYGLLLSTGTFPLFTRFSVLAHLH